MCIGSDIYLIFHDLTRFRQSLLSQPFPFISSVKNYRLLLRHSLNAQQIV